MSRSLVFLTLLAALLAPRPAGAAAGTLAVTPVTGPIGTTLIVTGIGFTRRAASGRATMR